MRYATWVLDWTDPMYGTGPEAAIAERGGRAEGAIASPSVERGVILGYVTGDFDTDGLDVWQYAEIDADAALAFAQTIDPAALMDESGRITFPQPE